MTPLGHASMSYLLGRVATRFPMRALVLGGISPDFDSVLMVGGHFNDLHRVVTHNLLFVLVIGLVGAGLARDRRGWAGLATGLGALIHILVDAVMDNNPSNGIGVALYWPFSNAMVSPFDLLSTTCPGWSSFWTQIGCMVGDLIWEVPFWLTAACMLARRRLFRRPAVAVQPAR
jgi:membrane-bound metal-dependent hydrolase YbcI (DUF457 family)